MIVNLLDNAVRHAPSAAAVRVELERPAGYAIAVKDGARHPAEIRPHIFERFYRGDAGADHAARWRGLGLALARWIANAHGGDVALARSSPAGSTFVVSLPSRG